MTPPQTTETRQAPNTAPEHHPLIEELAAKTDVPPDALTAPGVTIKPDARVPQPTRDAEPPTVLQPGWADELAAEHPPPEPPAEPNTDVFYRSEAGLEAALAFCDVQVRYNERAYAVELKLPDAKEWEVMTDRSEAKVRRILAERTWTPKGEDDLIPFRLPNSDWRNYIDALLADLEADPVHDYIAECSMTAAPFDGPLPNLLTASGFRIDSDLYPPEYQVWTGWLPIQTVVARALSKHRPIQIDVMPVLIGEQGIGKTTYYKQHVPPGQLEWVSEGFNWKLDHKQKLENRRQRGACAGR